ncbi:hypothetical protein E2L06_13105 [Haloterrigena sp. H1]|uniref:hypothetical protein n=1 Tax=Haloterrigena sp. H1 TaxID=2552943 RepID=UPI00110E7253|nr:hypothetical protein [Haloterrigena sp. H1]TMT87467.1 hypothetical protein E2L06_13105 [Haloterrigena sp. H1]
MDRSLLYHVSQMVVGGGLAMIAVSNLLSGTPDGVRLSIGSVLMIVGGVGILVGNGYHVLNGNIDRVDLDPVSIWLSVVAAILIFLAGVLSLLG